MIAIDTNILVYAHRRDSQWHDRASATIRELAEGPGRWGIPWPCIHEFAAIVTHPRVYHPPSSVADATAQIDAWLESPSVTLLGEEIGYWERLRETLASSRVTGAKVHDARIAAICGQHGVRELWTADRDFSRFSDLKRRNPLVG